MDGTNLRFGRETPPADYVLEVTCNADAESATRALLMQAVTHPGVQVKSLRSRGCVGAVDAS